MINFGTNYEKDVLWYWCLNYCIKDAMGSAYWAERLIHAVGQGTNVPSCPAALVCEMPHLTITRQCDSVVLG